MSDEEREDEEYSDEYNNSDNEEMEPINGEMTVNSIGPGLGGMMGGGVMMRSGGLGLSSGLMAPPPPVLLGSGVPMLSAGPNVGLGISTTQMTATEHEVVQEPSDNLTWIAASNGHIPEGAVVGGWSSTTQEPYYVARARSDGGLYHGVVLKSTRIFHSFFQKQVKNRQKGKQNYVIESNYEVLINNGELSWIFVNTASNNNSFSNISIVPPSAIELTWTATQNVSYYLTRTCSQLTGDIIVGVQMNNNGNFTSYENHSANSTPYPANTFLGYEVLCFRKDTSNSSVTSSPLPSSSPPPPSSLSLSVKSCFLYSIKYDVDSATTDWCNVKLDDVVLVNKSSVVQTNMMPSFNLSLPLTFKWEIPNTTETEVEIKGKIPIVLGGKDNYRVQLLDSHKFTTFVHQLPIGLGNPNPSVYTLFGGRLPSVNTAHIMPLGSTHLLQYSGIKTADIFAPTVVIVDDPSNGLHCEKQSKCDSTSFTVPSLSKVTVEYTGQEVTLSVPFKATLKIIYRSNIVHDEEVHGTYRYTSITASFPTVVGEKTTLY